MQRSCSCVIAIFLEETQSLSTLNSSPRMVCSIATAPEPLGSPSVLSHQTQYTFLLPCLVFALGIELLQEEMGLHIDAVLCVAL